MKIKNLHNWDVSYTKARELQTKLAKKVIFAPMEKNPKLIAGLDCAFSKDGKKILAAIVIFQFPELKIVETSEACAKVNFPYIPGLLSFREASVCIAAAEKLKKTPDCFIIDGQGIAHPRGLGLAAHLGLFFNKSTIGCAKSRLCGEHEQPKSQKGEYALLKKSKSQEIIGAVVRTRSNIKPVFVSVGNKCLLDDAIRIVLACTTRYRLPEPTRKAHEYVSKLKLSIS